MGGDFFSEQSKEKDPKKAFKALRKQAQYDCGHGGYTGTIAEKDDFIIVSEIPLEDDQIEATLDDCDQNSTNEKWGPAFARPLTSGGWIFYGIASS